jgi:MFS family permease
MTLSPSASQPGLSRSARIGIVALVSAGLPLGGLILWLSWWHWWSWIGVALISFSPMVAARLVSRFFKAAEMRPAMRRYNNRLMVTMVGYFLLLLLAIQGFRAGWISGPLGYGLALVPALPLVAIFALYGRYFQEETDEVQRAIVMTGLVWSGAASLCEATVWGFLEMFGKAPHLWLWAVPVAFFAQLGITGPLAARKFA